MIIGCKLKSKTESIKSKDFNPLMNYPSSLNEQLINKAFTKHHSSYEIWRTGKKNFELSMHDLVAWEDVKSCLFICTFEAQVTENVKAVFVKENLALIPGRLTLVLQPSVFLE